MNIKLDGTALRPLPHLNSSSTPAFMARPLSCCKSYLPSIFLTLLWLCLQWLTDNEKREGSYCRLTVNSWHLKANTEGNIQKQNSLFLLKDFWAFLATSRSLFSLDIQPIWAKFGQPLDDALNHIKVLQIFFILSGLGVINKLKKEQPETERCNFNNPLNI